MDPTLLLIIKSIVDFACLLVGGTFLILYEAGFKASRHNEEPDTSYKYGLGMFYKHGYIFGVERRFRTETFEKLKNGERLESPADLFIDDYIFNNGKLLLAVKKGFNLGVEDYRKFIALKHNRAANIALEKKKKKFYDSL